jgi:uncharacterized repeat protein (TIGR04076 family)
MKSCFNLSEFIIDTIVMKKICKYHKRKGQEYGSNDVVRDFCADAFYVAYPYCLAFLYGANKNEFGGDRIYLCCPHPKGIRFEIKRMYRWPFPVRIAKRFLDWVVGKVLYPLDWEDWRIGIKVVEDKGECPAKFSIGKTYWFNIRRLEELCPASFHNIYPFLLSYLVKDNLTLKNIHCPDPQGIIYNVRRC